MWINQDVDLPQALVTAQREGRLVIFAGAGLLGPPSNLPSFEAVADSVAEGVIPRKDGGSGRARLRALRYGGQAPRDMRAESGGGGKTGMKPLIVDERWRVVHLRRCAATVDNP